MSERAKIGFDDALGGLGDFAPVSRPKPPVPAKEAAEEAGFVSREVKTVAPVAPRQQRRHRTGRSAQINIKAKPETIEAFYAWADSNQLSVAEAFEIVVGKLSDS